MIVNENLLPINEFHLKAKNTRYNSAITYFDKLPVEEGEKYTLSFYGKQNEKGSGIYSLIFHRRAQGDQMISRRYSCNQRNSFTFVYTSEMNRFNFYADIIGEEIGVSADFTMLKLENGDQMTLYLPHKSNVKAENQAIFPIGGGITKSTLYKGYKGVKVC